MHLLNLKIMSIGPFEPINRLKIIGTNSIYVLQTWLSCVTWKLSIEGKYVFDSPQNHVNGSFNSLNHLKIIRGNYIFSLQIRLLCITWKSSIDGYFFSWLFCVTVGYDPLDDHSKFRCLYVLYVDSGPGWDGTLGYAPLLCDVYIFWWWVAVPLVATLGFSPKGGFFTPG